MDNLMKYTVSKLVDKLTWAEHTAGTLQAENDQLRLKVKQLEEENESHAKAFAAQLAAAARLEKLYKEKTGEDAPFLVF